MNHVLSRDLMSYAWAISNFVEVIFLAGSSVFSRVKWQMLDDSQDAIYLLTWSESFETRTLSAFLRALHSCSCIRTLDR